MTIDLIFYSTVRKLRGNPIISSVNYRMISSHDPFLYNVCNYVLYMYCTNTIYICTRICIVKLWQLSNKCSCGSVSLEFYIQYLLLHQYLCSLGFYIELLWTQLKRRSTRTSTSPPQTLQPFRHSTPSALRRTRSHSQAGPLSRNGRSSQTTPPLSYKSSPTSSSAWWKRLWIWIRFKWEK